ncbi:MAG: hypothetical protein DRJ42_11580 [Deltaproteobacteria bacterium]|nr:MAG: hypothetical protein DRJ42_11580 [Deltaproteobacteria bacterium]
MAAMDRRLLVLCLLLSACGASPGYSEDGTTAAAPGAGPITANVNVVNVTNNVYVAWGDHGAEEVDWEDARLARAVNETASLIGHPVEFHFNVSMMPRPTAWFFDALFERDIGGVPRDIERFKGRSPQAFIYGAEHLKQIYFDYDGSVRETGITFNAERGVLWVRMGGRYIPDGVVSYGFRTAYDARLDQRFDGRRAEEVDPAEFRDYASWIDSRGFRGDRERRAGALRNAAVLWDRTRQGPADVHGEITEWLSKKVSFLVQAYGRHADEVEGQGPGTPWGDAEEAWCKWVNAAWPGLNDEQRATLLDKMYIRRTGRGREDDPYLRDIFPGVDLFQLSLGVLDRWVTAGHPTPARVTRREHTQQLYLWVVCAPRPEGRRMYDRGRCDSDFWRHAVTDSQLRDRLFAEILRRDDDQVTEALFANLKWFSSDYTLEAWRHFETSPQQWSVGTRVLSELMSYSRQDLRAQMYDDSVRLWRRNPRLRGALLYLLACIETGRGSSPVDWDGFARLYGGPANRRDFDAFLSLGTGAVSRAYVVWPALARNANAADALIPHLERAMNDPETGRDFERVAHGALRSLVEVLRERRDTASMFRLRRFFEQRKQQRPSEARLMDTFISMTTPR